MNGNKYSLFLRLSIKSGVNYLHFAHSFTNQSHQASIPCALLSQTLRIVASGGLLSMHYSQRLHIRIQIRRQIDFVDHTDICLQEDMRIFQRLVIPFGGTDDNDFLRFSQIEHGRTNESGIRIHWRIVSSNNVVLPEPGELISSDKKYISASK